jgi:hypothetical protein
LAHQLRRKVSRRAKRQAAPGGLGARHPKAQLLSNKTCYSPTDLEARISVKPGKARALNYLCGAAVDTASGIISHIQADFADRHDSTHVPELVPRLQARRVANGLTLLMSVPSKLLLPKALPSTTLFRLAIGAAAVGALAVGALAVGALAIGALSIGQLRLGRVRQLRIQELEIDHLVVHQRHSARP